MTLPREDLLHVLANMGSWEKLRGKRAFITGGSGFVGTWLRESFEFANMALDLRAQLVSVPRQGMPSQAFDFGIHAAKGDSYSADMLATERACDLAARSGVGRLIFTSSGAVYGRLAADMTPVSEEFAGAELETDYAMAKRDGETLCVRYGERFGFCAVIARLFTFSGPALPLAANFAIGNFMRDVIAGGPLIVKGDGTSQRSYLYAADLAVWLWTLLLNGRHARPYNVGSPDAISISRLASAVATNSKPDMQIVTKSGGGSSFYVPLVERARIEQNLRPLVALEDGIRRMYAWNIRSDVRETRLAQPTTS